MDKKAGELLKQFQCDYIRELEETFAQTLSESELVRLFFINENEAFTDGRNIVVDPAVDELFHDKEALQKTGDFLEWPRVVLIDPWNALRIITRAQTIHECLHILYTDFPCKAVGDPSCDTKNKRKAMALIDNIIEDAYIEAVGCSVYDNMESYLKFGRVSRLFANKYSEGTSGKAFQNSSKSGAKKEILVDYLDYMATFLLYPMVQLPEPEEAFAFYVEATKHLFLEGSAASSPDERYAFTQRIFDSILPLIPEDSEELITEKLLVHIGGGKTHSPDAATMGGVAHRGRSGTVTLRLFTDLEGNRRENVVPISQLMAALQEFAKQKQTAVNIVTYQGYHWVFQGADYDCPVIHKDIKINENHPKINLNLRKAYQNIYKRYKININSYNSRFAQLLKAQVSTRDDKYTFGAGISSTMLGDPQKRCWYRNIEGIDVPDLAVMLLIDGSGSMDGKRRESAMDSAVILHEVLKKQGLAHAVVEHRAGFEEPEIEINILVDFNAREEEKYNLMQIFAFGDNRDGLALYWAERYMNQKAQAESKLIIVLSDGVPAHEADGYYPPVSTKDTANAVRKIVKRGINIIAIALDDEDSFACYEELSEIYPNLLACNDLHRLTGQLLGLVAKLLG